MSIARITPIVGSLYALMRQALGLNVATPLGAQELSCTVAPDRRLVVLGHDPIAGFARDHGTVADDAAMLALHTLDSITLLTEPTFVAPGDSCLRTDDPGWRWHCIANHGKALSDWERRPLAGALAGLSTEIAGAQPLDADLTAIAAQGVSAWGLTRMADSGATAAKNALSITRADITDASAAGRNLLALEPSSTPKIAQLNPDGTWTPIDVPSGGGTSTVDPCVFDWQLRVERIGGIMTVQSVGLATVLITALRDSDVYPHMRLLYLGLGGNLVAGTTPLIDRLGRGSTLVGMSESHFSESTGITFDGTNYIRSGYYPSDLGSGGNGGMGWWEGAATESGNVEPMGCADDGNGSNRFVLDVRTGAAGGFRWGATGNVTQPGPGRAAAHYYGQRSSATSRVLYRDGVSIATNSTSDAASGASAQPIALGAGNYGGTYYPWTGRCKLAYLTDGTLSAEQVAALHTALADFVAAIGR